MRYIEHKRICHVSSWRLKLSEQVGKKLHLQVVEKCPIIFINDLAEFLKIVDIRRFLVVGTRDDSRLRWHFWKWCPPTSVALLPPSNFFIKVQGFESWTGQKKFFFIFLPLFFSFFSQNSKYLLSMKNFDVMNGLSSAEFIRFEIEITSN